MYDGIKGDRSFRIGTLTLLYILLFLLIFCARFALLSRAFCRYHSYVAYVSTPFLNVVRLSFPFRKDYV